MHDLETIKDLHSAQTKKNSKKGGKKGGKGCK
jgi:hypothetical protein